MTASPLTADEWPTSDELWRMLHHALNAGLLTARRQILFSVGVCGLRGERMPAEYLPVLGDLEAFADEPDLPSLSAGQQLADRRSQRIVVHRQFCWSGSFLSCRGEPALLTSA